MRTYQEFGEQIDLVVLDSTMPRMNGEETFLELRRLNPDVQIILCSGYTEREVTARFDGKGLARFIQKPYTWQFYETLFAFYSRRTQSRYRRSVCVSDAGLFSISWFGCIGRVNSDRQYRQSERGF